MVRLQCAGQIRTRSGERGHESKGRTRKSGDYESEERDPQIRGVNDFQLRQSGVGAEPRQQFDQAVGGGKARDASVARQNETFGQQLPDQSDVAGAYREPNGDLPTAGASPRQNQPSQVRAGK
jgi:hypothetical protein